MTIQAHASAVGASRASVACERRWRSAAARAEREISGVEAPPEIAGPSESELADPDIPPLPPADSPGELPPPKADPPGTTEAA